MDKTQNYDLMTDIDNMKKLEMPDFSPEYKVFTAYEFGARMMTGRAVDGESMSIAAVVGAQVHFIISPNSKGKSRSSWLTVRDLKGLFSDEDADNVLYTRNENDVLGVYEVDNDERGHIVVAKVIADKAEPLMEKIKLSDWDTERKDRAVKQITASLRAKLIDSRRGGIKGATKEAFIQRLDEACVKLSEDILKEGKHTGVMLSSKVTETSEAHMKSKAIEYRRKKGGSLPDIFASRGDMGAAEWEQLKEALAFAPLVNAKRTYSLKGYFAVIEINRRCQRVAADAADKLEMAFYAKNATPTKEQIHKLKQDVRTARISAVKEIMHEGQKVAFVKNVTEGAESTDVLFVLPEYLISVMGVDIDGLRKRDIDKLKKEVYDDIDKDIAEERATFYIEYDAGEFMERKHETMFRESHFVMGIAKDEYQGYFMFKHIKNVWSDELKKGDGQHYSFNNTAGGDFFRKYPAVSAGRLFSALFKIWSACRRHTNGTDGTWVDIPLSSLDVDLGLGKTRDEETVLSDLTGEARKSGIQLERTSRETLRARFQPKLKGETDYQLALKDG